MRDPTRQAEVPTRSERHWTTPQLEIGLDGHNPVALAPFWLAALGYQGTSGDEGTYLDLFSASPEHLCHRLDTRGAILPGDPFGRGPTGEWRVIVDPDGSQS